MHHMVVMTVRSKDLDVDVPVLVNLPIRCMWGGQPDRWFVRGWGGITFLTTWVLAVWVVAGQDARNRRKRPVVYFPRTN